LLITDLAHCWYRYANKETILQEKECFAKAIQVQGMQGIMDIIVKFISSCDKNSLYKFTRIDYNNSIEFQVKSLFMNVYAVTWDFLCAEVTQDLHREIIIEDLVNPLLCSLKAMDTRVTILKKQYTELQADYIKRLTERERLSYKSKLEDNEDYWKYLVKDLPLDSKVTDFDLSEAANFFMKTYSIQKVEKQEQLDARIEKEKHDRELKKRKADHITELSEFMPSASTMTEDYVEDIEEINRKLELDKKMKKQVENQGKKPKLKFL